MIHENSACCRPQERHTVTKAIHLLWLITRLGCHNRGVQAAASSLCSMASTIASIPSRPINGCSIQQSCRFLHCKMRHRAFSLPSEVQYQGDMHASASSVSCTNAMHRAHCFPHAYLSRSENCTCTSLLGLEGALAGNVDLAHCLQCVDMGLHRTVVHRWAITPPNRTIPRH